MAQYYNAELDEFDDDDEPDEDAEVIYCARCGVEIDPSCSEEMSAKYCVECIDELEAENEDEEDDNDGE